MKIILASSSKQRQDIFKMIGLKYEVVTSNVDEMSNEKDPEKYPLIGNTIDDLAGFLNYVDNLSEADVEKITKSLTEDNMKYYKIINYQEASQLGVESVAKTHYYIIDYLVGNVYGPIDIDEMSSEANP